MIELTKHEIMQIAGTGCCNIHLYCQSPYTNKNTSDYAATSAYCANALTSARNYMCTYCEGTCNVYLISNTCGGSPTPTPSPSAPAPLPQPTGEPPALSSGMVLGIGAAAGFFISVLAWGVGMYAFNK